MDAQPVRASLQVSPKLNVGKCEKFCDFNNKYSKTGKVKLEIMPWYDYKNIKHLFCFALHFLHFCFQNEGEARPHPPPLPGVCALEVWRGLLISTGGWSACVILHMALTWPPVCLHREVIKITPVPLWYIPEHCLNNIVFYVATSDNLTNNGPYFPLCSVTGWGGTRREEKADAKTMQIRKSGPPFSREGDGKGENPPSSWIGAVCHHKKGCRFLAPQQWVMFGRPF